MKDAKICDYCNYISSEENVKAHENLCNYNPDNKTCLTCKFYTNKVDNIYELNMFVCTKMQRKLCENNRPQIVQLCDNYEEGTPDIKFPKLN